MKVAVLFSGGKDSTMALYNALEKGEDVKYLLSMKSINDESYMFHVPNIHITDLLAEALNIPIITAQTQGIKEEELEDLKMAFIKLKSLRLLSERLSDRLTQILSSLRSSSNSLLSISLPMQESVAVFSPRLLWLSVNMVSTAPCKPVEPVI